MKVDIAKAFRTEGEAVSDLLQERGVAYYIPLYQRGYSWDRENIDQMMEDISRGVESLVDPDPSIRATAIHFLGTVLLVAAHARDEINPRDERAIPARVDIVIDGQQRLSTLALIAALLYQRLSRLAVRLPKQHELHDQVRAYFDPLLEMFSYDLHRGSPQRKPLIIRGSVDGWTLNGADEDHYKSDISLYLARVIRAIATESDFPTLPSGSGRVAKVLRLLDGRLKTVQEAHAQEDAKFPPAWHLVSVMAQDELWGYRRDELTDLIVGLEGKAQGQLTSLESRILSLTQLFAFCHFLLQRCCLTVIRPSEDRWAFDMFQSLNATGTPLTAVETFKPLVVNQAAQDGFDYRGSKEEALFAPVDELLGRSASAAAKNKVTNQYLTTVAAAYDGTKLATRFSAQRKWLIESYNARTSRDDRRQFVRFLGNLAQYFSDVGDLDPEKGTPIPGLVDIPDEDERELATTCVLYLRDGGHSIAHSVLSRYYARITKGEEDGGRDFMAVCKAIAAFFTIWRSASANTGLDDVYREVLGGRLGWTHGEDDLNVSVLKEHFLDRLEQRGLASKAEWLNKATSSLRYDQAKTVCKFALFVTAQDTIPDGAVPGLMSIGTPGVTPKYLRPSAWVSSSFRSLEHVAPQRPPNGSQWDTEIYRAHSVHRIGNLTLLPTDVNSSAGNPSRWTEKWIYYRHLAEQDPSKLHALKAEADKHGISLSPTTLDLLSDAKYNHHIRPLIELGSHGDWNQQLIELRSERIASLLWDRVIPWLQ